MRPSELVPGNCYFSIGYHDPNLLFPSIQTLLYVGTDPESQEERRLWVFSDLSGATVLDTGAADNDLPASFVFPDDQLYGILDFAGLIKNLNELAVEHPLTQPPPDPGPASDAELGDLEARVSRFFLESDVESMTIIVEFTNDGLSFSRFSDGTTNLLLSVNPRLNPDREIELRTACHATGLTATQDYLANRSRTRILVYPIRPDKWQEAAKLAAHIFLDVYRMRRGDALKYHFRPASSNATA